MLMDRQLKQTAFFETDQLIRRGALACYYEAPDPQSRREGLQAGSFASPGLQPFPLAGRLHYGRDQLLIPVVAKQHKCSSLFHRHLKDDAVSRRTL
jgi:hypothetical protein